MCPAMELDFVERWIDHHLAIGVDHIFIYDTGPCFYTNKPEWMIVNGVAEHRSVERVYPRSSMDQAELSALWAKAIAQFKSRVTCEFAPEKNKTRGNYDTLQAFMNIYGVHKYRHHYDWMINIDGDEFLAGDLKELRNNKHSRLMIPQMVFEDRIDKEGKQIPLYLLNPLSNRRLTICNKNIVKPLDVVKWKNVHYGVELKDGKSQAWSTDIYFNHYRGHGYPEVAIVEK